MPEKYQDEIEEILRRAGEAVPSDTGKEVERPLEDRSTLLKDNQPAQSPNKGGAGRWPSITPGKMMLAGVIIFLVGIFSFSLLIWVGLGMLVVAYLLYFISPRSNSYEKRWRGRVVEEQRSAWQRVRRWLRS
ncbi:MAG: hypothetical protein BZY88_14095 [SAR202 cluster bacterium Io17-Chloro-G9]|nr:MAG: hypothetical protein BZY88_14095 [SAR202 cluster bacterium Io17-Chloro-G9]